MQIRRQILTGMMAATASLAFAATSAAQNAPSAFPMFVDGAFTNSQEWSDVTPSLFFSSPNASAVPVQAGDPSANTALYAAIGLGPTSPEPTLHLLYDFVPRTNSFVAPGELLASVTFPIHIPIEFQPIGTPPGTDLEQNVSVLIVGQQPRAAGAGAVIGSFFDIFVDLDLDGIGDFDAAQFGLVGAAGFGPSPLSSVNHLIVELGVGLRIPENFGTPNGPFPGNGINPATGLYDPDPVFWGAAGAANGSGGLPAGGAQDPLQPASAAIIGIQPNGGLNITPVLVPEPTSAMLLLGGFGLLAARRRK